MLQRLSQVAKADCNSGTVDHPESRLGASKFVNEVFECAILIHIDHIQQLLMQRLQQLPESKAWKRRPASPDADIPDRCAAKRLAMHVLPQKGRFYVVPGHSGCLDGLLSAAAAMQEEMGQDKSGGSWSPYWPFDVSNVSDCSRFWLQLMDSNANKKLV